MIIPRFTIRWLMLVTAVCAVLSFVVSKAMDQEAWAIGVSIGVTSLVFLFVMYSFFFIIGWMFSSIFKLLKQTNSSGSPFAADRKPTQLIPPIDPES